jgi:hypothetical protein
MITAATSVIIDRKPRYIILMIMTTAWTANRNIKTHLQHLDLSFAGIIGSQQLRSEQQQHLHILFNIIIYLPFFNINELI